MTYRSYTVQKKKLQKLWNLVERQEQFVNNEQQLQDYLKDNGINDALITLFESDVQSIELPKPGQFPLVIGSRTTKENTEVGIRFNYKFDIPGIDIPEILLPFINFKVISKAIPQTQIVPLHFWNFFRSNKNEVVKVAGTEIYNGIASSPITRYDQDDIDSGRVNANALKKVFFASKTPGNFGFINTLLVKYDQSNGVGNCLGKVNRKEILIDYHNIKLHQIQQMTTNGFTGIGNLTEFVYTESSGGACDEDVTVLTNNNSVSLNWANADSIVLTLEAVNGFPAGTITVTPDFINDNVGSWLYFGTDKYPPRVGFHDVGGDDTLTGTPTNFGLPVDIGTITATPVITDVEDSVLDPLDGSGLVIFELNEAGLPGTKKYKIVVTGEAVAVSQKTDFDSTGFTDTKKNTFTWNGTTMVYDESLSGNFDKDVFKFPSQDVQLQLVLTLKNPFYYRNQTNFITNE